MAIDLKKVHAVFGTLVSARQPWDAMWSEAARYYLPTSMSWNTGGGSRIGSPSQTRITVLDQTPAWAATRFASGMLGLVMNPGNKWLEFELFSETMELGLESQEWLTLLRDKVLWTLQAPEVGFYSAYHEHLLDYGIFGEACMFMERNPATGLPRFTPFPLEQCYIGLGPDRRPDKVFRRYTLTAQQLIDFFTQSDDSIPQEVRQAMTDEQFSKEFNIVHAVIPRAHGEIKGLNINKPFASIYYLDNGSQPALIRESGFDYFPYSCPRFLLFASETHGQGPGTLSLSDVRTLNKMIATVMTSDQRNASPAWLAARRGWIRKLNLSPDAINYFDGFDMDKSIKAIGQGGQTQAGMEWIQSYREQILRTFYLDRLNAPTKRAEMREVEVLGSEDERMRDLVPQLSRLHEESITAIITNVVDIVLPTMPPAPEELSGQGLKIRYTSPLARAQRRIEMQHTMQTLQQVVVPLGQIDPVALKTIDMFKTVNWALDQDGFPAEIRKSEEDFQAEQEAQMQQEQMLAGAQAGQQAGDMAKNFAQAQQIQAQQGADPLEGYI